VCSGREPVTSAPTDKHGHEGTQSGRIQISISNLKPNMAA